MIWKVNLPPPTLTRRVGGFQKKSTNAALRLRPGDTPGYSFQPNYLYFDGGDVSETRSFTVFKCIRIVLPQDVGRSVQVAVYN